MIIDSHCHAGKGDGLTGPADTNAPLEQYLPRARAAGIDRTVIFAALSTDYQRANRAIARMVRERPDRLMGFAFIHPIADRGRIASMAAEAAGPLGLLGLKVHRHDALVLDNKDARGRRPFRLCILTHQPA